jgi:hypothetical protein
MFMIAGILVIAGCKSEKSVPLTPAEQFVLSRLPGELRNTFMSNDGMYFCGEVGGTGSAGFRRFYANLAQHSVAYQGDHTFKLTEFASLCGVAVAQDELAADEVQRNTVEQGDRAAEQAAAQQKAYQRWIDANGQSIDNLNTASKLLK